MEHLGTRGCIFCSRGGSGDFAESHTLSVTEQIESGKKQSAKKYTGSSYIAYFQAYTNTYASLAYLEKLYMEAILHPDIRILSIATRPDCEHRNLRSSGTSESDQTCVGRAGTSDIFTKELPVISEEAMIFRYSRPLYPNFADGE